MQAKKNQPNSGANVHLVKTDNRFSLLRGSLVFGGILCLSLNGYKYYHHAGNWGFGEFAKLFLSLCICTVFALIFSLIMQKVLAGLMGKSR
jgi:hypothetical protein